MDRLLGTEMVQEQEQEREQEQEQEQEQEIEIEKYVDLAYARDHEEPTPWPFASLADPLVHSEGESESEGENESGTIGSDSTSALRLPAQFYRASDFCLWKRSPLQMPGYLALSHNYFDKRWSGARRLKNVVMVLDWVPDMTALRTYSRGYGDLSLAQEEVSNHNYFHIHIHNHYHYHNHNHNCQSRSRLACAVVYVV